MDIHKNARLTPRGREHMVNMVLGGQTPQAVAAAVGVCPRTVKKWVKRVNEEGLAGLRDRSSRPEQLRQPMPQATDMLGLARFEDRHAGFRPFIVALVALLGMAALFLVFSFIIAIPVFYVWNAVVPDLFHLSQITYWQSVLLLWLAWLLVKEASVMLSVATKVEELLGVEPVDGVQPSDHYAVIAEAGVAGGGEGEPTLATPLPDGTLATGPLPAVAPQPLDWAAA